MRIFSFSISLFTICCWWQQGLGQNNNDATAFYNKAMATIKPTYKNVVTQTAMGMKERRMNQDSLVKAFTNNKGLKGLNGMDIDALVMLVMQQVSNDAQADLNSLLVEMKATNQKKAQRSMLSTIKGQQPRKDSMNKASLNNKKDNMNDMSEMDQLKMQQLTERKNKIEEAISKIMKKISDTSDQIISNLK